MMDRSTADFESHLLTDDSGLVVITIGCINVALLGQRQGEDESRKAGDNVVFVST